MIILVANIKGGMARTTVSVMLARAFSQAGKRVVLADATTSGDSARYVQLMKKKQGLDAPFEIREFPNYPFGKNYDSLEEGSKLRDQLQTLRASMGEDGIVVIDTNSHHEDTLRILDPIADHVVVPYDYSGASLEPTLRTLAALTAPTTVLPYQRFSTIDADEAERLEHVTKQASFLSSATLRFEEAYTKCNVPEDTSVFDQLASEILKQERQTFEQGQLEGQLNEVVVQLNSRIAFKYKKLLNDLSRNSGKTMRSLIEEALESAYL